MIVPARRSAEAGLWFDAATAFVALFFWLTYPFHLTGCDGGYWSCLSGVAQILVAWLLGPEDQLGDVDDCSSVRLLVGN